MNKVLMSVLAVGTIGFSMLHANETNAVFCNALKGVAPDAVIALVDTYSLLHDNDSISCEQIDYKELEEIASTSSLYAFLLTTKNECGVDSYRALIEEAKRTNANTPEQINKLRASMNLSSAGQH